MQMCMYLKLTIMRAGFVILAIFFRAAIPCGWCSFLRLGVRATPEVSKNKIYEVKELNILKGYYLSRECIFVLCRTGGHIENRTLFVIYIYFSKNFVPRTCTRGAFRRRRPFDQRNKYQRNCQIQYHVRVLDDLFLI